MELFFELFSAFFVGISVIFVVCVVGFLVWAAALDVFSSINHKIKPGEYLPRNAPKKKTKKTKVEPWDFLPKDEIKPNVDLDEYLLVDDPKHSHERMDSFVLKDVVLDMALSLKILNHARSLKGTPISKSIGGLSFEFMVKSMYCSARGAVSSSGLMIERGYLDVTAEEKSVFDQLCVEAQKEYETVTKNMAGTIESLQDYIVVFNNVYGRLSSAIDAHSLNVLLSRKSKVFFKMLNPED